MNVLYLKVNMKLRRWKAKKTSILNFITHKLLLKVKRYLTVVHNGLFEQIRQLQKPYIPIE